MTVVVVIAAAGGVLLRGVLLDAALAAGDFGADPALGAVGLVAHAAHGGHHAVQHDGAHAAERPRRVVAARTGGGAGGGGKGNFVYTHHRHAGAGLENVDGEGVDLDGQASEADDGEFDGDDRLTGVFRCADRLKAFDDEVDWERGRCVTIVKSLLGGIE